MNIERICRCGLAVWVLAMGQALAQNPYVVGDSVENPDNAQLEIVDELLGDDMVLTDQGNAIRVVELAVADTFDDPDNPGTELEVLELIAHPVTGLIYQVRVTDNGTPPTERFINYVEPVDDSTPADAEGAPGSPGGAVPVTIPVGNTNVVVDKQQGSTGAGGRNGFGIPICIVVCFTLGRDAHAGTDGGTGPAINRTINGPDIESISAETPGVRVSSTGGNGGAGGNSYSLDANIPAAQGGAAGAGGAVTVTSNVDVATSGEYSYGVFANSSGGTGGPGGNGYINSGAGNGGPASQGGEVHATNNGDITTHGKGSIGLYAQSLGGNGGSGGDSYGLVGQGGTASEGGNGGNATATNNGTITTFGQAAHGVAAQSTGGEGGDGGAAGGIVALGGSGDAGGNAAQVTLTNNASGIVITHGAEAHGLVAQSTGGGGGFGGGTGGLVAIGASGEGGGSGGAVTLTNDGTVTTTGAASHAVFAESVGGGGGTGSTSGGVFFTLGGRGGIGGNSGTVTVNNNNNLTTSGHDSHGLFAQSVGGGGGNGGGAGSLSAFAGVAIGGRGSDASDGSTVTVNAPDPTLVTPVIQTEGNRANGIFAQSVGGGGGTGGWSVAASGGYIASASVAIGGKGGGGGNGGAVNVNGNTNITTKGNDAAGLKAQSVGGGGGNGGFAITFAGAGADSIGLAFAVGVGGSGGDGGDGGTVTMKAGGPITTEGARSTGLIAQSLGGGGGNGGFSVNVAAAGAGVFAGSVAVGVGGTGGGGGKGGLVDVTYAGDVTTVGVAKPDDGGVVDPEDPGNQYIDGDAVLIQSVGGGGGNGGFNIAGAVSGAGSGSAGVAVGVGGSGGGGGDGGEVKANITGNLTTHGASSSALIAQSTGGGGGNGGFNIAGSVTGSGGTSGAVSVGVGGAGGGGGNGMKVDAKLTGDATTKGADSDAVLMQSVGGSGGNGGFNISGSISVASAGSGAVAVGVGGSGGDGGNGGEVVAEVNGNVRTEGADSFGFMAQSLGGKGGNGGFNVSGGISGSGGPGGAVAVGVGGSGGGGGDGSTVTATLRGKVTTLNSGSEGVLAQSLGGSGGNGGFNITGGVSVSSSAGGAVSVGVGGSGGDGGIGGTVSATIEGDVTTEMGQSTGITVQSVGGGGGNGSFNITGSVGASSSVGATVGVGVGGAGGSGGNAGQVVAVITGTTITHGNESHGIFVQSEGGGGGAGAMNITGSLTASNAQGGAVAVGVGGKGGGGGNGASVRANVNGNTTNGNTTTTGDDSYGVLLQSAGGGGGVGGMNVAGGVSLTQKQGGAVSFGVGGFGGDGGNASAVSGNVSGDVTTSGARSIGVFAQSEGGGGGAGALNVSGGVGLSVDTTVGVGIGIGGFGGGGGNAGTVSLTRNGVTKTNGTMADGVVAQSMGGAGGHGGINISGGLSMAVSGEGTDKSFAGTFGIGGFGGDGGDAGNVRARVTGDVEAIGLLSDEFVTEDGISRRVRLDGSNGIVAQSAGGAGGIGALNVSGGIAVALPQDDISGALNIGFGGYGGGGGDAGTVTLDVQANKVQSNGDGRTGVAAQSLGGSGGMGGINITGGIVLNGQVNFGIGGFGGDGGIARRVNARADTDIVANGAGAIGFVAQSVGGGGGIGRLNVSGGIQADSTNKTPSLTFGLGGFGGAGNVSDAVTAEQSGTITVEGADSIGVLVQSVAGGGGNGGINVAGNLALGTGYAAAAGVGGKGGAGANAGAVKLTSDGAISVDGREASDTNTELTPELREQLDFLERANGILVQSVGGGGGNGGVNISGVVAPMGSPLAAGVGGYGGGGGDAGTVEVWRGQNAPELLQTQGNQANGITAQSIGGGGGNAGMNFVLEGSFNSGTDAQQLQVVIGGDGGDPGHGKTVLVEQIGGIATDGNHSDGILAQSIGGGGGNAAASIGFGINKKTLGVNFALGGAPGDGGDSEKVTVHHAGDITTQGYDSSAIFAQSIGGGGGNAAVTLATSITSTGSFDMGIGRFGGIGGKGRDVEVTSNGDLETHGERAVGIRAQSIGNGGGTSGGFSTSLTGPTGAEGSGQSSKGSLSVGLQGGAGGTSAAVNVTTHGSIDTFGKDAHAIHAQSVGGGGGVGGSALNLVFLNTNAVGLGVGGEGGTGGTSGLVDVKNHARLATSGDAAHGIYAQSIGGGGGVGGYAAVVRVIEGAAVQEGSFAGTLSVGGKGGTGAQGNNVDVTNFGSITTTGAKASGVNAESIGGGGGDGGMVLNTALVWGKEPKSVVVQVGGFGNIGGVGLTTTVVNEGTIHTTGKESVGIEAHSIGGGGGNGGLVANFNMVNPGETSNSLTITHSHGGIGGSGNAAGAVIVRNELGADGTGGEILTEGDLAHGIFAESLGGGGGNGSSVVSAILSRRTGSESISVGSSVGGDGGIGGIGSSVTVTNDARVETMGAGAHGIFARSVGGGGGTGGLALATNLMVTAPETTGLIVVGGSGGAGNSGGSVIVNNNSSVITHGAGSDGVVARSIGGGGGDAGIGLGATNNVATTLIGLLGNVLGGRGGDGGVGGQVTVNHSGDITVLGDYSNPVTAESLNGGGGGITLDFNGITSLPGGTGLPGKPEGFETDPVFDIHIGGTETQNSNAGLVTLNYTGTFGAAGDNGAGSNVQAIGGGGGTFNAKLGILDATTAAEDRVELQWTLGGSDGVNNKGGDVVSTHLGDVVTEGMNTPGAFMQSIGGGGGRANLFVTSETGSLGATSVGLGGANGTDEGGGSITHTQAGTIATSGTASHGALMQSIGGGGGMLSYILQGSATSPAGVASKAANAALAPTASVTLALGSAGGSGLDGNAIDLDLSGDLVTDGDHAVGLISQSIGGGGGTATVVGASELTVTLGGSAGASGNGGDLEVTHTGDVSTTGAGSHGVLLQSIGGGGGALFSDVATPEVSVSLDNSGNGGSISFVQTGNIVTMGVDTNGIVMQSLGGGGGLAGAFAGSAGGAGAGGVISLTVDGELVTMGDRSTALFAQSAGASGGGDIHALLTAGSHIVGGANGIAIAFDGGASNAFANHGSVMTLSGLTGMAFTGGSGNDAIVNDGVVIGNIALGGGANSFANHAGATFYSGGTLDLGAANNLFINDGLLSPGATNLAVVTNLAGSLRQSDSATSEFELDFSSATLDSIVASGTAVLDGTVELSLLNTQVIMPGDHSKVLYSAAGGLTDNGLSLSTLPSVVITYGLQRPNSTTAALGYQVNFAPSGLGGNRVAIGDYLNRVQLAGSTAQIGDTISTLVAIPDLASYSNALTQMGAEFYAERQAHTLASTQRFSRTMQECGGTGLGPTLSSRRNCAWARIDDHPSTREADADSPEIREDGNQYSFGFQSPRSSGWTFGAGVAFEDNVAGGFGSTWEGDSKVVELGLLARRVFGRSSAGAVLSLGQSKESVSRRINITEPLVTTGERDTQFFSAVFDLRHDFDLAGFVVTPGLDLGVSNLGGEGMRESGADALNTTLQRDDQWYTWLEPTLSFGYERSLANSKRLRAFARVGALFYLNTASTEVRAGLEGAPAGVDPMRISSDLDHTHFLAEGGLELIATDRFTFALAYTRQTSETRTGSTASMRVSIPIN